MGAKFSSNTKDGKNFKNKQEVTSQMNVQRLSLDEI